ncbi:MAG TPA: MFS transporter [Gaiellaceae bacterium]|nr:MFS transporter [Gaiellaceae bacterium]
MRLRATTVFYALELLLALPTWVVVSIYLVRELQLSPLQLVLMGTAMEAAVFAFEIPTGVVADTYGRRLSLVVGFVGSGLAWLLVGAVSAAWAVIALWVLWGFFYTFTSGAYQAWITDEVGAANVGPVFLRGARLGFVGGFVGLVGLVALGTQSLRAAVILGGAITVAAGLFCAVAMPETGFAPRPRGERAGAWRELHTTARSGFRFVRAQTLVLLLVVSELFAGTASEAFDRLKEAHVLRNVGLPAAPSLDPVVWFGIFSAVSMVFGFFAVSMLLRRIERRGTREVAVALVGLVAAMLVAELVFAFAGVFALAAVALLAVFVTRALADPLYLTWLNQQITDSSVRATVISISGQANAVGQAAGGPLLGGVGNVFGIPAALAGGALLLVPTLAVYGRALRYGGVEPELAGAS